MINVFGSTVDPWVFWTFILVLIGTFIIVWRFVWDWRTNRPRLIIKTSKLVPKDEIMTQVINKTGQQIRFGAISFGCERGGMFDVPSELRTFDGTDWGIDDSGRRCIILDNNARYVFWSNINDIKEKHFGFYKIGNVGSIKCVNIVDYHGRIHKGRIPRSIKKLLNK